MFQRLFSSEPSAREVLEAHLRELLEKYAPSESEREGTLRVLNEERRYRVVVEFGLSRLEVFSATRGRLKAQLPVDRFLPGQLPWTAQREHQFQTLGSRRQAGNGQLSCWFDADDGPSLRRCAAVLHNALYAFMAHPQGAPYTVAIEPELTVENQELMGDIRTLVKQGDMESRRQVYQTFVNSRLYLPLGESANGTLPRVKEWPSGSDALEWVVFSDLDALTQFGAPSHILVSGIRIVQSALEAKVSSLRINPASRVGGELFRAELRTIADYLTSIGVHPLGKSP